MHFLVVGRPGWGRDCQLEVIWWVERAPISVQCLPNALDEEEHISCLSMIFWEFPIDIEAVESEIFNQCDSS